MKALILMLAPLVISATPPPAATCQPAPPPPTGPGVPANSTYTSESEPPQRFAHAPSVTLHVAFGRAAIDANCGQPPCNKIFLGCEHGDLVVLPDPFAMSDEQFARIVRHELAHVNNWPATHGD